MPYFDSKPRVIGLAHEIRLSGIESDNECLPEPVRIANRVVHGRQKAIEPIPVQIPWHSKYGITGTEMTRDRRFTVSLSILRKNLKLHGGGGSVAGLKRDGVAMAGELVAATKKRLRR
jgi:hypothetical protein